MYVITGVDCKGKRFRKTTDNLTYALAHNVYRGCLWQVTNGKRKLICRWFN